MEQEMGNKIMELKRYGLVAYITTVMLALWFPLSLCEWLRKWIGTAVLWGVIFAILVTVCFLSLSGYLNIWSSDKATYRHTGAFFNADRSLSFVCVFGLTYIIAMGLNWCMPLVDMPRKLPGYDEGYTVDDNRLVQEKLGVLTLTEQAADGSERLWVCRTIEAYGPIKYTGETEDLLIRENTMIGISQADDERWAENCDYHGDTLRGIKFLCQDGYAWVIVKCFESAEMLQVADKEEHVLKLHSKFKSSLKRYTIVWSLTYGDGKAGVKKLNSISGGNLSWEKTKEGYTWTPSYLPKE